LPGPPRFPSTTLFRSKDRLPVVILRPPMVIGPRDRAVLVLIRSVAWNLMLLTKGSTETGDKYYSLIHCEDLCQAMIRAAEAPLEDRKSTRLNSSHVKI